MKGRKGMSQNKCEYCGTLHEVVQPMARAVQDVAELIIFSGCT